MKFGIKAIGKIRGKMRDIKGVAAYSGASIAGKAYDKGIANYKVLALGLDSGMPIPKLIGKCRNFWKENRKDWLKLDKKSDGLIAEAGEMFDRVSDEIYSKPDAVFIREKFLPFLEEMKQKTMYHFTSRA